MDFTYRINGIDVIIEDHSDDKHREIGYEKRARLIDFYKRMMKITDLLSPERSEVLTHIINNLTEEKAQETFDYYRQSQRKRMLAYVSRLSNVKMEPDFPENFGEEEKETIAEVKRVADSLTAVTDATSLEELKNQETIQINGNKFTYEKGTLDIADHVKKLFDIGENVKGETWSIYLDEEGDLVIY